MSNILENIKKIRDELGYSQEFVGERLGMAQASYGLIENGKRQLRYDMLEQIAIIFKMPVIDIITYPKKYLPICSSDIKKRRVTLQIDIEDEDIKADVIKLAFGERVLEIKNVKKE